MKLSPALLGEGVPLGLFERDGFAEFLCAHSARSPQDLCNTIFASLADYRGEAEQYDDMTLLVVKLGAEDLPASI